ncbi:hypothetical protein ACWEK7_23625, partial [Streptomyces californicus]
APSGRGIVPQPGALPDGRESAERSVPGAERPGTPCGVRSAADHPARGGASSARRRDHPD